jgi:hypothetical protein
MADRRSILLAVLLGSVIAGTADIGAAALINGQPWDRIARVIAGGLLGKAALKGSAGVVALGVLLQWAMSMIIAALYVGASLRVTALRRAWPVFGLAYGLPVFVVMEFVVLPLSAWGRVPKFTALSLAENLAAMMVFGLIVAGVARWRLGGGTRQASRPRF